MGRYLLIPIVLIALCIASSAFAAIGDEYGDGDESDPLAGIKQVIGEEDFAAAVPMLEKHLADNPEDANAWNLAGFALRKAGKYERADAAYNKALELDPNHKSALEYQAELFILQGRIEDAKSHRARLAALCPDGCAELEDLDQALSDGK